MKRPLPFLFLLFCLLLHSSDRLQAQVAAIPFTAALDTFVPISGTVLDAPNADDMSYPAIPIGFTFQLGGHTSDVMAVNTNGYIELDSTGTGSFANILSGARNNLIAPFGADLKHMLATASLQYGTYGTAPNRVCIIQWQHYSYFNNNSDISFQLQLYEGTNCIRFIYDSNILTATPLNTQIGMRGTTNLDFLVLGDTTCSWANAYPFPLITTLFPVSTSCCMPSGFAFHFGPCNGNAITSLGYLTGTVFNDANANGTQDAGEAGLAHHILNIQPGNYYVATDAAGNYTFYYFDSTTTYTITAQPITYWNQTAPAGPITCQPSTQSTSGLDFAFTMIPGIHEVSITCPSWPARPGQPEPMPIWYENNGTATESDTITFVMDSLYSYISATPAPDVINGQTLQWSYSNLAPGQRGRIQLSLMPSLALLLGDSLHSSLTIGPLNDTIPGNNVLALDQLVSLAWDPNDKLAEPRGLIADGQTLSYTIRFQNTGNAVASNVVVRDTLDANLDPMSFHLIGASHPMNLTFEQGVLTFTFFNIMLPDSGTDQAGSNGYIRFTIRARSGLAPLTDITNTAAIYFDHNPAVITNTTVNTVELLTSVAGTGSGNLAVTVAPNPAGEQVQVRFGSKPGREATLHVSTLDGRTTLRKAGLRSGESVDLSGLAAGTYLFTVTSEEGSSTLRVVRN
jgi:uncharacterized repeat protein (TIGR01451 family)